MKKNKKRNFIVLGIVIVLVACIAIMLFQVKGEKKEVVETDQNSYRYIKVDGKDYRYRTNLKTILFLNFFCKFLISIAFILILLNNL